MAQSSYDLDYINTLKIDYSSYSIEYPDDTLEMNYLYSLINNYDAEPEGAGTTVMVWIIGSIAAGILFDGVKWVVVNVYNEGLRSTLNKVVHNMNRLTPQNVPGRSGEINRVYATSSGSIQAIYDSSGCVLSPSGMVWNCPYRI